jgi:thiamine biosynthesis lipoprotein
MSSPEVQRQADGRVWRTVEQVMGMPVSVALRGRHANTAVGRAAWAAVIDQLREVDRVFSTYRDNSVISRLGRGELTVDQCPPEVAEVLALGSEAERQSDGAFSINLPTGDGRRRLDPSGVVKGWATQRASQLLTALDDTDFCLSAGGDIVSHASSPERAAWRIGIENPRDPSRIIAVVPIRSGAVATSGTAHRGAHLIDPRTGQPPQGVASVTVVAASLTWADIDATAAYIHGHDAARWLQSRPIRSALVVWADGRTTRFAGHDGHGADTMTEPQLPTTPVNETPAAAGATQTS